MGYRTVSTIERYPNLLVVDNSVIMRWFFSDGSEVDKAYAEDVLRHMKTNQIMPVVPTLWVSEACFVSNSYVKKKGFSTSVVQEKLTNAFDMLFVVDSFLDPVVLFDYAYRYKLSDYDANYALLAENLNCPLATLDKKLKKAVISAKGSSLDF